MTKSKELLSEFAKLISEEMGKDKKDTPKETPIFEMNNEDAASRDSIEAVAGFIERSRKKEMVEQSDPLVPLNKDFVSRKEFEDHYKLFASRVQTQLASIGGGGEVKFLYLDDVARYTATDNWVLEYDAATGKVQFTDEIGPISTIKFDITHDTSTHSHGVGEVCWNDSDQTLNIFHPNGVVQQVGQELYAYVRNNTGVAIPDGTVVQFAGAEQNGTSRLEIAPFLADGTYPSLYAIGVTTETINDGEDGRVTAWGKVRGINASGSAVTPTETWNVGDILYAHPTDAGKLTKIKPTSPNNVAPIAAVLNTSETDGELFVRPTIEQRYDYGTVSSTQSQTQDDANEAKSITFDTIQNYLNVNIDDVDASKIKFTQSGLYTFNFNAQALSSNSSSKEVYFWIRQNGIDIPYSTRIVSIVGNNVYTTFHVTYNLSLEADDYVQFMWASTNTTVELHAAPITDFSPSSPSVSVHIDQSAL